MVQQLTGDYPAAAASHHQALELYRDIGDQLGQAEALNNLGELSTRTATRHEARSRHRQALKIARDINAPFEEARALEGIGGSYLHEGNDDEGLTWLRQALTIYQRIGAPAAQRVKETLHNPNLPESAERPLRRATGGGLSDFRLFGAARHPSSQVKGHLLVIADGSSTVRWTRSWPGGRRAP
jgi:tetratricopeptide (TPR) repeat protein